MGESPSQARSPEREGAQAPRGVPLDAAGEDLRRLLARTAARLVEDAGLAVALAWGGGGPGAPRVLAAAARGALPEPPPPEHFPALAALPGAADLGRPGGPQAAAGFAAAVPVGRGADGALAVLLVAGPEDPPGGVRPRTLAALDAHARRLESPAAAAAALARLARLDAAVQRLDRLAALGDLLAEIAHEVRNPLVAVKTFLQLLPDRLDDPEFRTQFLAVVSDEVRRIERLLDVVIEHARPPAAAPPGVPAPVAGVLASVRDLVAQRALQRQIALEVEVAPSAGEAAISADALRQVVLNLVLNALEATPSGGRVALRAAGGAGSVEIRVEDEGPGIPAEQRARLFEPFFSTKSQRAGGLGLWISRRLVEEAGGRLGLDERPGAGAAFRIALPRG